MRSYWTHGRITTAASSVILYLCTCIPPAAVLLVIPSLIITLGRRFPWMWAVLILPLRLGTAAYEAPSWFGIMLEEGQRGMLTVEVTHPPVPVHLTGSLVEGNIISVTTHQDITACASVGVLMYVEAPLARTMEQGDLLAVPFTAYLPEGPHASELNRAAAGDVVLLMGKPLSVIQGARSITLDVMRSRARMWVRSRISSLTWESQILLSSLMLGRPLDSRDPLAARCREAGAAHVMALSGLHAGILITLCMAVSAPILGRRGGRIASLCMLTLFLWFSGAGSSLMRSVLMCWIFTAAGIMGKKVGLLEVLCASCIIHVSCFPADAGTLSFRLSYAAVLGLSLFWSLWHDSLTWMIPPILRGGIAASLAASTAVWPVLALHGLDIRPVGILISLPSVLGVTVLLWAGCAYLLVPSSRLLELTVNRTARLLQQLWESGAYLGSSPAASPSIWVPLGALCLTTLLLLQYGRFRSASLHGHTIRSGTSLQLTGLDPGLPEVPGAQAHQAVRSELPHQPGQEKPDNL